MKLRAFALLACCGLACERPPVVPSQDPAQKTELSHIDGNVVVQSHARGNALVFLFDATRPPPPVGTGKPVSFAMIPEQTLFGPFAGDPTSTGPFTAPFHFSLVPPGNYILQGFIDQTSSFIPWFTVTDEPNSGDVGGAAADPVTQAPVVVTIDAKTLAPATDVTVSYADPFTLPVDRPAFSTCVVSTPVMACMSPATGPVPFTPTGLFLDVSPAPVTVGSQSLQPVFLAKYSNVVGGIPMDADGDPQNGPDFWPKVIVRKVDDKNPLRDENVDSRGIPVAGGKTYAHQDSTLDGQTAIVVLAAGVYPPDVLPALTGGGGAPILSPMPVAGFHVVINPLALDAANPAKPAPLKGVPPGLYAVYVVEFTGQTWRLPNELQPLVAPAVDFAPVASQGFIIEVPDAGP